MAGKHEDVFILLSSPRTDAMSQQERWSEHSEMQVVEPEWESLVRNQWRLKQGRDKRERERENINRSG